MEAGKSAAMPRTVSEVGSHRMFVSQPFIEARFLHVVSEALGNRAIDQSVAGQLGSLSQVDAMAELARRTFSGQSQAEAKLLATLDSQCVLEGLREIGPCTHIDGDWKAGADSSPLRQIFSTGPVLDVGVALLRLSIRDLDRARHSLEKFASFVATVAYRANTLAELLARARSNEDFHAGLSAGLLGAQLAEWPRSSLSADDIGPTHVAFPALLETLVRMASSWAEQHAQISYHRAAVPRSVRSCRPVGQNAEGTTYRLGSASDLVESTDRAWCGGRSYEIRIEQEIAAVTIPPLARGPLVVAAEPDADGKGKLQAQHEEDGKVAPHGWRDSLADVLGVARMAPAGAGDSIVLGPRGSVLSKLEVYDSGGELVSGLGLAATTLAKGEVYRVRWKFIGGEPPGDLPRLSDEKMVAGAPRWNQLFEGLFDQPIRDLTVSRKISACVRQGESTLLLVARNARPVVTSEVRPEVEGLLVFPRRSRAGNLYLSVLAENGDDPPDLTVFVETEGYNFEVSLCLDVVADEGNWVTAGRIGVVATHAALMVGPGELDDVKVLCFGYDESGRDHENKGEYHFWDPQNRLPFPELDDGVANRHDHSPFCSGHAFLPDGDLLVAGGHINHDSYDGGPAAKAIHRVRRRAGRSGFRADWDHAPFMNNDRWYPTVITLASGHALILGGSSQFGDFSWNGTNEDYEVYDPSFGLSGGLLTHFERVVRDRMIWENPVDGAPAYPLPSLFPFSRRIVGLYSHGHLLPASEQDFPEGIVYLMTEVFARLYDPSRNGLLYVDGSARTANRILISGYRTWPNQGTSVLLPIDVDAEGNLPEAVHILAIGGGREGDKSNDVPGLDDAELLTYDVANKILRSAGHVPLDTRRFMGDSVLLPTGEILVVNGSRRGYTNENSDPVLEPTLLRISGSWSRVSRTPSIQFKRPAEPAAPRNRRYHSSALLLPDGSVFVGGSSGGWGGGHFEEKFEVDVYEPWYMACGSRPELVSAPSRLNHGQVFTFAVGAEDDIREQVVLIRFSSATHQINTDQRLLRIAATYVGGHDFRAIIPRNRSLAPPGPYLMFVLSRSGIPSRGRVVLVGSPNNECSGG